MADHNKPWKSSSRKKKNAKMHNAVESEGLRMDSRRFLSLLNDSAQAKVASFEERVTQMGRTAGQNWRLAALHARNLYIENVDTHQYYLADHIREAHGRVTITNIRPIKIVEEEKNELFAETCSRLVDAIEENDQRGMQVSFDRMKAQRFSGRAVPQSGMVKCRDGILRQVNISNNNVTLEGTTKNRLVTAIVESLRDRVLVENGMVVAGNFNDGDPVRLPVTKWASRKLVARRMMEAANNAYWSVGFQTRVYNTAKLVSESKIDQAVRSVTGFLNENEEFTLLNRQQVQTLVENALAAKMIFNQQLCDDTATLLFRTNMKISRNKIIDEWRNIARASEHSVLAENVNILEESNNFESSYQKFLTLIFETISNREVAAEALATTLESLRNKTPKIKESNELSGKLSGLITRLKDKNLDDAAIYEAEDLIATIQEELAAADSLQNFDQMPGGEDAGMDLGASPPGSAGAGGGAGAPVININSPLIQIGGQSSAGEGEGEDDLGGMPDEGMEPPAAGGDEDLDALLGAGGGAPPAGAPPAGAPPAGGAPAPAGAPTPAPGGAPGAPLLQSRERYGRALSESRPSHYEMRKKDDDDQGGRGGDDQGDPNDPYAIKNKDKLSRVKKEGLHITDYGAPVITDEGDLEKIMRIMQRLAVEHKLTGAMLEQNLPSMAKASVKAVGLRIPESKMGTALEQVINTFTESMCGSQDEEGGRGGCGGRGGEDEEDSDEFMRRRFGASAGEEVPTIRRPAPTSPSSLPYPDLSPDHILNQPGYEGGRGGWGGRGGEDDDDSLTMDNEYDDKFDDDEEGVAEDQYKSPGMKSRGYKRSSIASESISWGRRQSDAMLGEYAGVKFIFDHGGDRQDLTPIVMSEDGSVEIPVPSNLYESAFAAAKMVNYGDPKPFTRWLRESIEQLRTISDVDDLALSEAMAKITTGPNGEINVEVSDDVEIDSSDAEEEGDVLLGGESEEEFDMKPVDSIVGASDGDDDEESPFDDSEETEDDEDAMPDFEKKPSLNKSHDEDDEDEDEDDEEEDEDEDEDHDEDEDEDEDEDDDEGFAEDSDITDPSNSKYAKHVKDNLREFPKPKLPKAANDDLEDIGPSVKKDDGSGTKPPTSRKGR